MCNSDAKTMSMLSKTVEQFLEEGRMFTGYDVTIETRERESINLRHRDCRGDIHEIEELEEAIDFGYENSKGETIQWHKTQVPHPNGRAFVFVFHQDGLDPTTYQFRNHSSPAPVLTASSQTASTVPSDTSQDLDDDSDSGGVQSDGTYTTDYRRRLFVPTSFLKESGIKAGDSVKVVYDVVSSAILISEEQVGKCELITNQIVEKNGDMRLSMKTLGSAGFNHKDRFIIRNVEKDILNDGNTVSAVEVTVA